jgi:hypothetical protein
MMLRLPDGPTRVSCDEPVEDLTLEAGRPIPQGRRREKTDVKNPAVSSTCRFAMQVSKLPCEHDAQPRCPPRSVAMRYTGSLLTDLRQCPSGVGCGLQHEARV